jgi:hypothetical protein
VRCTGENCERIERAIKWSWRSPGRETEAKIHAKIEKAFKKKGQTQPLTIALVDPGATGGDVDNAKVDIQSLRSDLEEASKPVDNLVQTCILLQRVGKPIWEYEDDTEIIRGARDILQGRFCSFAIVIIIGADMMTSRSRISPSSRMDAPRCLGRQLLAHPKPGGWTKLRR